MNFWIKSRFVAKRSWRAIKYRTTTFGWTQSSYTLKTSIRSNIDFYKRDSTCWSSPWRDILWFSLSENTLRLGSVNQSSCWYDILLVEIKTLDVFNNWSTYVIARRRNRINHCVVPIHIADLYDIPYYRDIQTKRNETKRVTWLNSVKYIYPRKILFTFFTSTYVHTFRFK